MADWRGEDLDVAERYRIMARHGYASVSPTYERLSYALAEDGELLALVGELPVPRQQPNLVFGAARWLGAPLDSYPTFREWFVANWPAVKQVALTRSTQTNEVRRVATWLPALPTGPLALIEIGASAGLCLYPDRWRYRYEPGGTLGDEADPVLTCATEGSVPVPATVPDVVWRRGLDLNPLDVNSDDDVSWLRTLIWPGQTDRLDRLDQALEVARRDPATIVRGDLLTDLEPLLDQVPGGLTPVVLHSAVLAYIEQSGREHFADIMRRLVAERGVVWISNEAPDVVPGIPAVHVETDQRFVIARNGTPLALAGQHGASLHWL